MIVGLDLTLIRARLLAFAAPPIGYKKVSGATDLDTALANGLTIEPAGFVLPLAESADDNGFENGVIQQVQAMFGVVTAVRALVDAQGEAAVDALKPYRQALFDALLNWTPDGNVFDPCTYGGGQLIGFRNQTVFWQDDFVSGYIIRKD